MNTPANSPRDPSEPWEACPPGQLQQLVEEIQQRRRRRRATRASAVGIAALLLIALVVAAPWRDRGATPGGITCQEVQENLEAFVAGTAPSEMAARIRTHLEGCPRCRAAYQRLLDQRHAPSQVTGSDGRRSDPRIASWPWPLRQTAPPPA